MDGPQLLVILSRPQMKLRQRSRCVTPLPCLISKSFDKNVILSKKCGWVCLVTLCFGYFNLDVTSYTCTLGPRRRRRLVVGVTRGSITVPWVLRDVSWETFGDQNLGVLDSKFNTYKVIFSFSRNNGRTDEGEVIRE